MIQWQAYHQVDRQVAILFLVSGDQDPWDPWGQWDQWDPWSWDQVVLADLDGVRHSGAQVDLLDHGVPGLLFLQE